MGGPSDPRLPVCPHPLDAGLPIVGVEEVPAAARLVAPVLLGSQKNLPLFRVGQRALAGQSVKLGKAAFGEGHAASLSAS